MMLRIGLTGGIGSGKSTVARLFAGHGVPVIDTDELAREVVKPGEPGHLEIVQKFGTQILDTSGALDRIKMRNLVFSDPAKRKSLEQILHPRIRDAVSARLAALKSHYAVVVVPLLIETGFDDLVDRILVVDCDEALQIQRVMTRSGMTEDEVRDVMAAQASRQDRLARADDVIQNNGAAAQLDQQVTHLHQRYLSLADS